MDIIKLGEKESFKPDSKSVVQLINEDHLQLNMICLEAGQEVPYHRANSNVSLMVAKGEGELELAGEKEQLEHGKIYRVPFETRMRIVNNTDNRLSFLVFKTPNPKEMI
ncbi:hypothetical protein B6U67_01525 [Methanosarcinales archaeon ex4484_138]|nr:MAG: hypothetical protein B6U67_01525 [Methanosarcinales archaeon ex4484_138]RLG27045.1 MAG: hypothetical protein DRN85_01175 [Methanosarcinales archaeon]RLG28476.1 MAG: hypothetical protein DRN70_00535 [Methanosarcinales archaeon]HHI30664.1 cupin domain-containing protein [Candidatus Methanoperedenaceae archaeon]